MKNLIKGLENKVEQFFPNLEQKDEEMKYQIEKILSRKFNI